MNTQQLIDFYHCLKCNECSSTPGPCPTCNEQLEEDSFEAFKLITEIDQLLANLDAIARSTS